VGQNLPFGLSCLRVRRREDYDKTNRQVPPPREFGNKERRRKWPIFSFFLEARKKIIGTFSPAKNVSANPPSPLSSPRSPLFWAYPPVMMPIIDAGGGNRSIRGIRRFVREASRRVLSCGIPLNRRFAAHRSILLASKIVPNEAFVTLFAYTQAKDYFYLPRLPCHTLSFSSKCGRGVEDVLLRCYPIVDDFSLDNGHPMQYFSYP